MGVKFTNNAEGVLASAVGAGVTVATLTAGQGALFPVLGLGDWFPLYLIHDATFDTANPPNLLTPSHYEIVRAIARTGDSITIQRQQEGTTEQVFVAGDRVSLRLTQAAIETLAVSGGDNFTVKRGVNFGVDAGSQDAVAVTIADIEEYTDKLEINAYVNFTNTGAATLAVNTLPAVPIKLPDNTDVLAGMLVAKKTHTFRYNDSGNYFVLENPEVLAATAAHAGLAKRATIAQQLAGTENEAYSTPAGVKQQIDQSLVTSGRLGPQWNYLGDGSGGSKTINGADALNAGWGYEYTALTIGGGGVLTVQDSGPLVIRVQGTATIEGQIIGARGRKGYDFVGGRGGQNQNADDPPDTYIGNTGANSAPNPSIIELAILGGLDFAKFQGGEGADGTGSPSPQPGGAIIILADLIVVTASAEFDVTARPQNTAGSIDSGGSGGGCVILGSKQPHQVDPAAQFFLAAVGDNTNQPLGPGGQGAGPGWLKLLNLS